MERHNVHQQYSNKTSRRTSSSGVQGNSPNSSNGHYGSSTNRSRKHRQPSEHAGSQNTNSHSSSSIITSRSNIVNKFDMVTLLETSNHLTTRQKQLLVALHRNDMQYLIDLDIMREQKSESSNFNFHFSEFEITPLMLACAIGNPNIVKILLQSPIVESMKEVDKQGFNCLYYAVYSGHLAVVNLLKKKNVEYKKDAKGTTCLHIAIIRGHYELTDFFLRKTPKYVEQSESPNKAMRQEEKQSWEQDKAAQLRKTNLAIQWESHIDIDEQRIGDGFSGVFFAIRAGNKAMCQILRNYGANFNLECMSESKQRMRPVQYAVYRGAYNVYESVLAANSDNLESQFQSTMSLTGSGLLHLAAFKGDVKICKDLLEKNLNPFQQNKGGDTSMHIAIRRNHVDFVLEIIRWSAANNTSCSQAEVENAAEAQTPYMTAVLRENFDLANMLLKNNLATKGYVNREGRDVRQIAVDQNRHRCLAYLDNREIPRKAFGRDNSVDQVVVNLPMNVGVVNLDQSNNYGSRKNSTDPATTNKNDIFGNSYGIKMHQQSEIIIKNRQIQVQDQEEVKKGTPIRSRARGLVPVSHEKPYMDNSLGGKLDTDSHRMSLNSSSESGLRGLPSPIKRPLKVPKMAKLDLSGKIHHQEDDIDKVNVRTFIKQSQRGT